MRIADVRRSSPLGRLGQPVPEPSAVSATVHDAYGRPYPNIAVSAAHQETGQTIAKGTTDHQGQVKIGLPASGLQIVLTPEAGFFLKAVPEQGIVTSLPVSTGAVKDVVRSNWGWGDSVKFKILPKGSDDFLTTTNLVIAGGVALAVWYFFFKGD
jgi:hypothetical protein